MGCGGVSIFVISVGIIIEHTKIEKVIICTYTFSRNTWVYYLWGDKSSSVIEAYKNNGYAIELKDRDIYKTFVSIVIVL